MRYDQVPPNTVFYFVGNPNYPKLKTLLGHHDIRDHVNGIYAPDGEVELASPVVELIYFKETGKYYTSGSFSFVGSPSHGEIVHQVRYWKARFDTDLPGLNCPVWEGYILVTPQREDLKIPHLLDLTGGS